ncbi:MAG: hypothetical protein ABWZ15_08835 [Acidimicrobiia bacterium]
MPRADVLHIRRHVARHRVARAATSARPLKRALTETLAAQLALAAPQVPAEGVWRIRRLDVRTAIAPAWSEREIARAVAVAVVHALTRTIAIGADGEQAVWFPDRASFLARYLVDCANERARERWEYDEFGAGDGPSAMLRAIVAEPEDALVAFVRATRADRQALIAALYGSDAAGVLAAFTNLESAGTGDPAGLVVSALGRLLERGALPADAGQAALALFVEVATAGGRPAAGTAARGREIAELAAVLRDASAEIARAVGAGDWSTVGAAEIARLAPFVAWPAAPRAEAVELFTRVDGGAPELAGQQPEQYATHLGGMFLLLPLLDEFAWRAATAGWPPLPHPDGPVDAVRLAQYLAVIGLLGADRNASAPLDVVLRLALGIPARVDAAAISAWSNDVTPDAIVAAHRAFVAGLQRLGKVSGEVTIAPMRDGVVAVDNERGIWLGTAPAAPSSIAALHSSLTTSLGTRFAAAGTEAWIEACIDTAGEPVREPIDAHLLTRLADQARHATLGAPFDLTPPVRDFLLLVAQAIGRELAWRLPGFARSTLPYLAANFLAFDATVEVEQDRYVVAVGDPPLHLVLSLTGMNRRRFVLPATGTREWLLTQAH